MASSVHRQRGKDTYWGSGGAFAAGALCLLVFFLGRSAALTHSLVNWDGLYAASAAYTVVHARPHPTLSLIGFANPPLASILLLPVAWVAPGWCTVGLAQTVLGAAACLFAAWWYILWMHRLSLPFWIVLLFVFVIFLHPVVLSLYAGGSPAALFFSLILVGLGALANWARTGQLRDLITASLFLGLAALSDHFGILIVGAATLAVGLGAMFRRQLPDPLASPGSAAVSPLSVGEGTAIFFAMIPTYLLFLWVAASWAIVGDPWASWRHWTARSAQYLGHLELFYWLTPACGAWGGAILFALLIRRRDLRSAALGVLATIVVAMAFLLGWTPRHAFCLLDWAVVAAPVLAVKAGVAAILSLACAELVEDWRGWWAACRWRVVAVAALCGGALVSVSAGLAGGWPAKPWELLQGRLGVAGDASGARSAAKLAAALLPSSLPSARVGVYLGDTPGFAVGLFAGQPWRIMDIADHTVPRPGDLHLIRAPTVPADKQNRYPLKIGFSGVKPVFVGRKGGFLIFRFVKSPAP